jgi:RNA recognition motif-containing protein
MNIFVGNLSFASSEDEVRSLFESYGTVDRVSVVTDRDTGKPRGFGFVEMRTDEDGNNAIEALNGYQLDRRALTVSEARPKENRGSGYGAGGQRISNRW